MSKQEKILKTALKLFVANGFHGTPTSKIAKEAGVANGTLFHHYETKEDLIVSCYVHVKSTLSKYITENVTPHDNTKSLFRQQFILVMQWAMENKDDFYYTHLFTASPFASLLSDEMLKEELQKSCDQIQSAIDEGVFRKLDVDYIHVIMGSHIFGLYTYLMKKQLPENKQQETINESFDMLWKMLS